MGNSNYIKGRKKEYSIVKELKLKNYEIAQRSAGSHSPIDIFAINRKLRKILFIQAKPDNFAKSEGNKILEELNYLNGVWEVEFELR